MTCTQCDAAVAPARAALQRRESRPILCLRCGERAATQERKGWCILTPHKQGPMFFTAAYAREAAIGINNKGGLVK